MGLKELAGENTLTMDLKVSEMKMLVVDTFEISTHGGWELFHIFYCYFPNYMDVYVPDLP